MGRYGTKVYNLSARRISLDVSDSARAWLAEHGYDPVYGARPLRRLVQTEIGDQLARLLLSGKVHDGARVVADRENTSDHVTLKIA